MSIKPFLYAALLAGMMWIGGIVPVSCAEQPESAILVAGQVESQGGQSKEAAIAAAEKKAVMRALARMITPTDEKQSLFQQIAAEYHLYLSGKTKVVKIQEKDGRMIAFCRVPVDFVKLKQCLAEDIKALQESDAHRDDEAFFFVRVTGITNPLEQQTGQAAVLNFYTDAFQEYGFQKGMADELLVSSMKQYASMPEADYVQAMIQDVKNNVAISLAVIGEIHLEPSVSDESGTNSSCRSKIVVVYNSPDGAVIPLGTFEDTYTIRRTSKTEAEKLVLQKAAYNSAKYLSHVTVTYWKQHS